MTGCQWRWNRATIAPVSTSHTRTSPFFHGTGFAHGPAVEPPAVARSRPLGEKVAALIPSGWPAMVASGSSVRAAQSTTDDFLTTAIVLPSVDAAKARGAAATPAGVTSKPLSVSHRLA